jgi:hypothetical protein
MGSIVYGLREEYAGTVIQRDKPGDEGVEVPKFSGGVVSIGNEGESLDIAEALEEGGGEIVVSDTDQRAVIALDEYPALKRLRTSDDPPDTPTIGWADRLKVDLVKEADSRGIEGGAGALKDDLVQALTVHDELIADGGEIPEPLTVDGLIHRGDVNDGDSGDVNDGDSGEGGSGDGTGEPDPAAGDPQ